MLEVKDTLVLGGEHHGKWLKVKPSLNTIELPNSDGSRSAYDRKPLINVIARTRVTAYVLRGQNGSALLAHYSRTGAN